MCKLICFADKPITYIWRKTPSFGEVITAKLLLLRIVKNMNKRQEVRFYFEII
jgi:hypothetical protein